MNDDIGKDLRTLSGVCILFIAFCWSPLCNSSNGAEPTADPPFAAIEEIAKSALANANVSSALNVLRNEIGKTRSALPPGFSEEFGHSIVFRLNKIQRSVSNNVSKEYRSALTAKRILELAEQVTTLPYRRLPQDPQERRKAQQECAAVLDRVEKAVSEKAKDVGEESQAVVIRDAFRQVLTDAQHDIFQSGYGRPLSPEESLELNRIIDEVLANVTKLPKPPHLREAARVANQARQAARGFFLKREAGLAKVSALREHLAAWHRDTATLQQIVDYELRQADELEIAAVIDRARQQGEKDLRENDPKRWTFRGIFYKMAGFQADPAAKERERALHMEDARYSLRWLSIAAVAVLLLGLILFARLKVKGKRCQNESRGKDTTSRI